MKNIKFLGFIAIVIFAIGCSEDFLEQKNLYQKSDESYYKTPDDIQEALAGAYAAIPIKAGNNNPFMVAELISDLHMAGGGSNDDGFHATGAYQVQSPDYYLDLFETSWQGILRANLILSRFDQAEYTDLDAKDQALGEAYFLRAYFYFRLSQFFGPVPLKLEPAPANLPRATPDQMYGQIALDLKTAIELMPSTPFSSTNADFVARDGHATKWAAQGLLGRVFLYYTGLYGQSSIALPDGTTLTAADVVDELDDCIARSGHGLLTDFRNNWTYANVNVNYPFAANNGLVYADGAILNKESVFAVKYSIYAGWSPSNGEELSYSNQHVLYSGLRQQEHIPFGQGWGGAPLIPTIWDSFEDGDLRREGSILNVNIPGTDEGDILDDYVWGSDNQVHESGLWCKKYLPIYDYVNGTSGRIASIFFIQYNTPDNMQLWNMQDDILIRFSDIMLMSAELGSPNALTYVNDIRERVDLDPVASVTQEVIQNERKHEFIGEGLRHFDTQRWGIIAQAHAAASGFTIKNQGVDATYTDTYRAETGGFLPIPETEITLSEGVLEQTQGW